MAKHRRKSKAEVFNMLKNINNASAEDLSYLKNLGYYDIIKTEIDITGQFISTYDITEKGKIYIKNHKAELKEEEDRKLKKKKWKPDFSKMSGRYNNCT